tara:strand:+ start:47 stop:973 length:927 start_codon:yes stop_codon:yes gene_type:complete
MPIDHFQAQKFGRLEFLAKQAVEGFITGLHKSPYHGFSVEFAEHRAYNTGESVRHVDWKLFGRTDKMFVKRYEEETNLRCNIIIDRSGSMFYPKPTEVGLSKIQFAVQSAASLIYLMRKQRDAAGVTLFGDGIELTTPAKSSSAHHAYLFAELEKVYDSENGAEKSTIVDTIHLMAEKASKRSLIIIFSDFMDTLFRGDSEQSKLFEALQHMRYNKHEVVLFHMFHKSTEIDLKFNNRPWTFVDLETNEQVKVNPHEIQDEYHGLREAKIADIKLKCRQYGVEWNECNVEDGMEKVLDRFLAKRKRMG